MPLPEELPEGSYLVGGEWYCEDCAPIPLFTGVTEPPPGTRCISCRTALGHPEERVPPDHILCGGCGQEPAPYAICAECSGGACTQCVYTCSDCAQTMCRTCSRNCVCDARRATRCLACSLAHTRICGPVRARVARTRYPAFEFMNDSSDDTLIVSKHVRPKTTKKVGRRPIPGTFVVPVPRARHEPEPDDDDRPY